MQGWRWLDDLIGRMRGARVGVLGERGVGKTHLQTFLRERTIPQSYKQTLIQERLPPGRISLLEFESFDRPKPLKLAFKPGFDVPGSEEAVEAWKEVINASSILLYLFRADLVYRKDAAHLKRIIDDATLISKFLENRPDAKQVKVALVGTHYDMVIGYPGATAGSDFYEYHQRIAQNPKIGDARLTIGRALTKRPALVVGSMKTMSDTRELAFRLFAKELRL